MKMNKKIFDSVFTDPNCLSNPTRLIIQEYCLEVIVKACLQKESTLMALIYIERLLLKTGFGLTAKNWKSIILVALILSAKNEK